MKQRIIYIALAVVTVFTAGCKKYLDIVPTGSVIPKTVSELRDEMNTAYALLIVDKGIASYRGDEIKLDESAGDFYLNKVKNHFLWDEKAPESSLVSFNWQNQYKVIFYANHILSALPDAEGAAAEKNQLLGEAYLLRAYTYFNLVNLYGDAYNVATSATDKSVPLVTVIDMEAKPVRSTVKAVYDQILADMAKGKELVNVTAFEENMAFKFTTVAADALEARVYLYMKNWQKSLEAADAALAKKATLTDLNQSIALFPNVYNSVENIMAMEQVYNTDLLRSLLVSDELKNKYNAENDLRYAQNFKLNGTKLTVLKNAYNNKFKSSFRVGELYLTAAEASAQLNNDVAARKYLNQLKKARLTPAFYTQEVIRVDALSGTALLGEIYEERARELAFEGHRWFDLKRTTQPAITHIVNNKPYTLNAGDPRYTITIPKVALDNNPALKD
jgi:hypothetical protein